MLRFKSRPTGLKPSNYKKELEFARILYPYLPYKLIQRIACLRNNGRYVGGDLIRVREEIWIIGRLSIHCGGSRYQNRYNAFHLNDSQLLTWKAGWYWARYQHDDLNFLYKQVKEVLK